MKLKGLAKIIYEEGTASENRKITVVTMQGDILWEGIAKDLINFAEIDNWLVCEMLVNESDVIDKELRVEYPRYNKEKIIVVY